MKDHVGGGVLFLKPLDYKHCPLSTPPPSLHCAAITFAVVVSDPKYVDFLGFVLAK